MAAISVIVPIYKVEAFLHRCVDSILAQTFADFDLVLVDDGSPDSCGDICEEYARKDGRIHVIHQKNGGLSAARNTGWAQANSDSRWPLNGQRRLGTSGSFRLFAATLGVRTIRRRGRLVGDPCL